MKKQLIRLISRLPFRVLYFLSDIIYGVIYYIVRYRLAVVRMNLRNAFPEKTPAELRKIEKGFYHFLCDYGVESLKLLTISAEEMKQHMVFENVDQLDQALDDHNFVFVYIGHYGNWEWMSSLPLWARKDATLGELYRPLKSKTMDDIFIEIRQHFNAECISKYEALRHIMRFNTEKRKCIIGFVADQTPHPDNTQLWMDFLSQDTPIFTGTERIGKKVNAAIYFADIHKEKRGHYRCVFKRITHDVKSFPDYEITETCTRELEQMIRRQPEIWLWSHKRWKHKRTK